MKKPLKRAVAGLTLASISFISGLEAGKLYARMFPEESITNRSYQVYTLQEDRNHYKNNSIKNDPSVDEEIFELDREGVKKILKTYGYKDKEIQEYLSVFPWLDEIKKICDELGIDDYHFYAAKVFVESSGNPLSVSKQWYARGLLGTRYAGAYLEIWNLVHSKEKRYQRLRERFPKIYQYFKDKLQGDKLQVWKKYMIENPDPEFGLWLGITYSLLLDDGDKITTEVKYNVGPTFFKKNPHKAVKNASRHVRKVLRYERKFKEMNQCLKEYMESYKNI